MLDVSLRFSTGIRSATKNLTNPPNEPEAIAIRGWLPGNSGDTKSNMKSTTKTSKGSTRLAPQLGAIELHCIHKHHRLQTMNRAVRPSASQTSNSSGDGAAASR